MYLQIKVKIWFFRDSFTVSILLEAWTKKSLVAINLEIDLLRWDIWSEPQSLCPIKNCLVCHLRPVTPYDWRHSVCFYKKIEYVCIWLTNNKQLCAYYFGQLLFQDSEETIHSAEKKWYLIWMGCLFSLKWSKKKIFFWKKKLKSPTQKKSHFPTPPIINIFSWNFYGLILGLVELIDAKGIGVAQLIWLWGCPT